MAKYLQSKNGAKKIVLSVVVVVGITVLFGILLTGRLNNKYEPNDGHDGVNATLQNSEVTSGVVEDPLDNAMPAMDSTAGLSVPEYFDKISSPESVYDIRVDEGKLISGPSEIRIKKDTIVRVNVLVKDEEARLRLEGYEIITESDLPSPGGFSFIANKTGDFKFYALPEDEHDDVSDEHPVELGHIIVE